MGRLENRIAIITGGAGGQGEAEVRRFAREGASVVFTDLNPEAGEKIAADVREAGGQAHFIEHDVTSESGWIELLAETKSRFGGLHILVNNAGTISRKGIEKSTLEDWDRTMAVNLTGPMLAMKYGAPLIRDSGGGSIVNISSTAGLTAHQDAAYTASKWGLRGLTKSAAIEFAPWKVRVNTIHPTQIIATSIFREGPPGHSESALRAIPLGRQGTPEECASLVLFLASDESEFITGAEVAIDGGFTAGAAVWMRSNLQKTMGNNPDKT